MFSACVCFMCLSYGLVLQQLSIECQIPRLPESVSNQFEMSKYSKFTSVCRFSTVRWGFGSCHSFGVAVGSCGYGMCQMRRAIGGRLFLKMRRVGHFIFQLSNVTYFFKVQVVPKPFTCPRGKSLLVECHPLDDQIVRGPITANGSTLAAVGDFGGLNYQPTTNVNRSTKLQ